MAEAKSLKIIFCGDDGVGKRVLIHRFHKKELKNFLGLTVGGDFRVHKIKFNNVVHNLHIL
jgi:GTPase SAR1 family protein